MIVIFVSFQELNLIFQLTNDNNMCGKYCVNAGKLKKHNESHKQKICDLCGKTFKNIGAHIAGGRMCKKYAKL